MKEGNIIVDKSFLFSIRMTFQFLREKKVERDLCVQLLNSGTSIGANIEEAVGAASRKDFINKLQIAYKEARETRYWLKLMKETDLLQENLGLSLLADCEEIIRILTSILNSSKGDQSNS